MINATGNRMNREITRQSRLAGELAATQVQVSTGKRIQRASDDSNASARISSIRTAQANEASWARNTTLATSLTAQADTVMGSVSDLLARAKELSLAAVSPTATPADRASITLELNALADEVDSLAATRSVLGDPLFAEAAPLFMRFSEGTSFAPVPSRAALFDVGGQSVAQHIRSGTLSGIDSAIDHVANGRGQIGINAARLDRLREVQSSNVITLAAERSTLEDTDLTSAIAKLNSQTITLEAAQAAFARINRRSLFDILG
jgi:flagellar hook-associated protein 3 FlgL